VAVSTRAARPGGQGGRPAPLGWLSIENARALLSLGMEVGSCLRTAPLADPKVSSQVSASRLKGKARAAKKKAA
jgi:hypothetical protein